MEPGFLDKEVIANLHLQHGNFVMPALKSLRQEDHDQSRLHWEILGPTANQTKTMIWAGKQETGLKN